MACNLIGNMIGAAPACIVPNPGSCSFRKIPILKMRASSDGNVKVAQQQQRSNGISSNQQQQQQQLQRQSQSQSQSMPQRRSSSPQLSPFDLWDPFMPASRSLSQMMDLMNQVFESEPSSVLGPSIQRKSSGRQPWDVMEDDESFMMRVDMPGLSKEEVKVSVIEDGILVIRGEMSEERKEGDKWAARSSGSYESRVAMPDNVELEKIKAELKDGVLYVTVPKKKIEGKQPIEIQVS